MAEIEIKEVCGICDQHKTELGILVTTKESVEKNFANYSQEQQMQLIITWFEQYKLDQRTAMIQGFKQKNIKSINR